MSLRCAGAALVGLAVACGGDEPERCEVPAGTGPAMPATGLCLRLSSYRLFTDLPTQTADPAVVPYQVAVPLYTDDADKLRWRYLPPGGAATWADVDAFELPAGSMLVKTFAYPVDQRDPAAGRRLVETRVLLKQGAAWTAGAYVYRDDGSDADLAPAGATLDVAWRDAGGAAQQVRYRVPDAGGCLTCHGEHQARMAPLGWKARHMNTGGQLEALIAAGALAGAPDPSTWPRDPAIDDAAAPLDARARAWLDVTCAHCHNPTGAARTAGLDLTVTQTDPDRLGVCQVPLMGGAGRGYDIVPGQPDRSALVARLEATDPLERMPSLGRTRVDTAGVSLIRAWIAALPGGCP